MLRFNFWGINYLYLILCMLMFCIHVSVCTTCVPSTQWNEWRALDLLELKLQMVVNHHTVAGN